MRTKIFLVGAIVPIVMSIFYIQGWLGAWSIFIWVLLLCLAVIYFSKSKFKSPYLPGFLMGFMWGVLAGIIQFIYSDTLFQNNPERQIQLMREGYKDLDYVILVTGPMYGVLFGIFIVFGLFILKRLADNKEESQTREA